MKTSGFFFSVFGSEGRAALPASHVQKFVFELTSLQRLRQAWWDLLEEHEVNCSPFFRLKCTIVCNSLKEDQACFSAPLLR